MHDAPGEGEAECALLQKQGIVDAVMTEDVDAIMFGSTRTIRNWTAEGKKSQKTPTHVDFYDVKGGNINGYTREGLVLVAMMAGGDYLPNGIKGCGVKVAGEAALAGFGKSLCRLKRNDVEGRERWKASLIKELATNENKVFRVKHKALSSDVPDEFPNMDVLRYYTRPVVSPVESLELLRSQIRQEPQLQLNELREFTRQTFGWDYRIGAEKFIKTIGASLLTRKMLYQPEGATAAIQKISTRREHFSTDAEPELRISYIPEEVVPIDLSQEQEVYIASSTEGLALNDDEEEEVEGEVESTPSSQRKPLDVTQPVLSWVLEEFARRAVPDLVTSWEDAKRSKQTKSPRKKKGEAAKAGMPPGAIDRFFTVTKKASASVKVIETDKDGVNSRQGTKKTKSPPVFEMPASLPSSPVLRGPKSKHTEPSKANEGADVRSLQETPNRSRSTKVTQEAIVITSSPINAPASPSPRHSKPQSSTSGASQISSTVYASAAATHTSQKMSWNREFGKKSRMATTTTRKKPEVPTKASIKYKQTSLKMFTQRSDSVSSQPLASSQVSQSLSQSDLFDPFGDSSDNELPPLSSMTSVGQSHVRQPAVGSISRKRTDPLRKTARQRRSSDPFASDDDDFHSFSTTSPVATKSPKSPGKRLKSPSDSEREPRDPTTPTKDTKPKKKLFAPRQSEVGFYKEIEVDADKRDEMIRELERLQGKGTVARVSDVSLIDLTQDD